MDDYSNPSRQPLYGESESSGAGTGARRKLSEAAIDVKERVADFGRRAADRIDGSRHSAAGALDRTASSLHTGGEQISGVAHSAASRIQATADYVRQTDLKGMADDVQDLIKRYPGQSLAAAAILGFLVARGFRRD
jgi:ElaB/YqjD/DUF883 family membrane-anchored ribosome-binding protein